MVDNNRTNNVRIGVQIAPNDPFWVQVNETVRQELKEQYVPFEIIDRGWYLTEDQMDELGEEILSNEFAAFICMILPSRIINFLLENGVPIICVEDEIDISHPLFCSVAGWYDAGQIVARFLVDALDERGNVLCLKGNVGKTQNLDFSRQRIAGIKKVLDQHPQINVQIQQSYWDYPSAYEQLKVLIAEGGLTPPDAILGLSDSMALAAKHAGDETGFITEATLIAGINGEPVALAEMLKGKIQATVNIQAEEFAGQAVKLARQAARKEHLPSHFAFSTELVTRSNVAQVALQKLDAISNIPTRLVGINRQTEESRLIQYELTASINRKMAVLKDKRELILSITELLRVNYDYDRVYLYSLSADKREFLLENANGLVEEKRRTLIKERTTLHEVYKKEEAIFIADVRFSGKRFPQDPKWKEMRSRVALPVRFGERMLGILDLQSDSPKMHLRNELIGLQLLADQLGVALHNAELYEEAIQAKAVAEKANQLKTRLLANVSHELRAPLNIILGYCQAILANPSLYHVELPPDLFRDLGYIFDSGEHLIRLINDLLDVSRAEIGALDLFPETVSPMRLLQDVFGAMAEQRDEQTSVEWRLQLASSLPLIKVDAVRLRQILINLLSNAKKFTDAGSIVLGAEVQAQHLHLWVQDTGCGISKELQQKIFEPFVTADTPTKQTKGIGLGLNITRRLVLLHGGKLTLESKLGQGSTFHVYLPLPNLSDEPLLFDAPGHGRKVMLGVSSNNAPNQAILDVCKQQSLEYYPLRFVNDLEAVLDEIQPVAIAWDMANYDPTEWWKIEHIREHPDLNRIPFLIYENEVESIDEGTGMTNILTKPIKDNSLYDYLLTFRPDTPTAPILIVDDDPQSRQMYKEIITNNLAEFEIIEAKDGDVALELLDQITPALILLDLMMPVVDGFKVLEAIRTNENTRHVPVIVISGKVLTFDDVRRLDYSNVIYQRKDMLSLEETIDLFKKVFGETEPLPQPTSLLVKQALAYLQQNYHQPISRQEIADAVNANPTYLSRIFSQEVGISLWDFLARLRIQKAKEMLHNYSTSKTITDIAMHVGYNDPAYFCKVFKQQTGLSPRGFRKLSTT